MTHNSTIDLTENNKSKPSGSQNWDDNLQAVTNNSNKKSKDNKTTLHNDPSKSSKSINVPRKNNTLIVGESILKRVEGWRLNKGMKSNVLVTSIPGTSTNGMIQTI